MKWERIYIDQEFDHGAVEDLYRLKVPGGWLYRLDKRISGTAKRFYTSSITFVPDVSNG